MPTLPPQLYPGTNPTMPLVLALGRLGGGRTGSQDTERGAAIASTSGGRRAWRVWRFHLRSARPLPPEWHWRAELKMKLGIARLGVGMALAAAFLVFGGCDDAGDEGSKPGAAIEVVGTWDTQFDSQEVITATAWTDAALVRWDNADNWAITQNAEDAQFGPGTFTVLVWTEPAAGKFYYCTAAYGLESQAAAEAADRTAPDADATETTGCGGFAWTRMTAVK